MRVSTCTLLAATAMLLVLSIPSTALAQHKHKMGAGMPGMKSEMAQMMKSPHHLLMTAHMRTMLVFARALREQAAKPEAIDVEFARAAVAELRHNLDAMDAIHQKHMQTMSAEMQSKMKIMMEKMEQDGAMLKDQVAALETDVQANMPDAKQVTAHTNALLKHLGMMSMMHGGKKKMGMKKTMDMKKKPAMKM